MTGPPSPSPRFYWNRRLDPEPRSANFIASARNRAKFLFVTARKKRFSKKILTTWCIKQIMVSPKGKYEKEESARLSFSLFKFIQYNHNNLNSSIKFSPAILYHLRQIFTVDGSITWTATGYELVTSILFKTRW